MPQPSGSDRQRQHIEQMPLEGPSALLPGRVVHHKSFFDVQAGGTAHGSHLAMREDVPACRRALAAHIPANRDIATLLAPDKEILDETRGSWYAPVVPGVVAMTHVDKRFTVRRKQPRKLAQNLDPRGGREDVSEHIPKTQNRVKPGFDCRKVLGAHGADIGSSALHRARWFKKREVRNAEALGNSARTRSISRANIEQRTAARRNSGNHEPLDALQIRLALTRQLRECGCNPVVCGNGIQHWHCGRLLAQPLNELLQLSATQQARQIRQRKFSSRELIEAHLNRIRLINPSLNAAVEVFEDQAIDEARAADAAIARGEPAGPLHGAPFSVKDSIELRGRVCTAGTLGRKAAAPSTEDATLVQRLRAAGAIPIAKTNLPDLLFAFESNNLIFGATNNPYDLARTCGGSSGGEAALIAACGSPLGLGSDAAGSVRLPAAFCGIASIKPTSGRLPRTGHFPPASGWIEALWQIGPMARRVEDLSTAMALLVGPDGPFADPARVLLDNLRIAFYTGNGFAAPDAEVSRVVQMAARSLTSEVLSVEENRPGCLANAYDLEMKLLGADGGDSLWRYLADLGSTQVHPLLRSWLEKLEPYRVDLAGFQRYWAEWDAYRAEMSAFFRSYDVILCPVYTQPALLHGASTLDENFRGFSHTMAYNVTGWPAAVVRCGESAAGLPIGVQIVAHPLREDIALAVAMRLEEMFGGWKPADFIS